MRHRPTRPRRPPIGVATAPQDLPRWEQSPADLVNRAWRDPQYETTAPQQDPPPDTQGAAADTTTTALDLATALWWLVSLLLAAYVSESHDFGATYGPLTGVMALLLWANLTGIALFVGVAFAAQLEATRVGISGPAVAHQDKSLEERTETTLTSRA